MTLLKLSSLKRSLAEIEESCTKRIKSGDSQNVGALVKPKESTQPISRAKRKAEEAQEASKRPKLDYVVEKLNSLSLSPSENKLQLVHVKPLKISIPSMIFSSLTVEDVTEKFEGNDGQLQLVKYQKPIYQ